MSIPLSGPPDTYSQYQCTTSLADLRMDELRWRFVGLEEEVVLVVCVVLALESARCRERNGNPICVDCGGRSERRSMGVGKIAAGSATVRILGVCGVGSFEDVDQRINEEVFVRTWRVVSEIEIRERGREERWVYSVNGQSLREEEGMPHLVVTVINGVFRR